MFSVPAAQRLNQSTTVEAEVSRLTKESSMQGLGVQPLTKEDLKKKAAATKVRLPHNFRHSPASSTLALCKPHL